MKSNIARKRKAAEQGGAQSTPEVAEPQSLEKVLERCRNKATAGLETITDKMVEIAQAGSCQHAKFVFELAGQPQPEQQEEKEDSLAALLLRELEEPAAETGTDA